MCFESISGFVLINFPTKRQELKKGKDDAVRLSVMAVVFSSARKKLYPLIYRLNFAVVECFRVLACEVVVAQI